MSPTRWIALALLLCTSQAPATDWPGWRGPRGDGTSDETHLPLKWGKDDNIAWKTPIPGVGHSSPVIWGDKVFLTTCIEEKEERLLLCLDRRTGKLLWQQRVVKAKLEPKHGLNSYASSTPATDGEHLYVSFLAQPNVVVVCYDLDGKEIWRKSPGKFYSVHGFCSSPVLYRNLVILNCDQDAVAYVVALDKATGEERWRTDRPNKTRSYCVPLVVDAAGKPQLVLSGSKCVASYDPNTGKQYWIIDGPTEQFVASLVYTEGMLFLTGGFPDHHLMGIRPDGTGDVTRTHVQWHETKGASYVPSPIAWGKHFFVVSDGGQASCFDARTGQRHWMQRLGKHHSASPVAADGYLYFPDDDGVTWVLKAGERFDVAAKNDLGEEVHASPAIAGGQIFIRGLHDLYCIGVKNGKAE